MLNKIKILTFTLALTTNISLCQAVLPEDFIYLDEFDSTIRTSLRYVGNDNFIGKPIDGYKSSRVILTEKAAKALSEAQSYFKKDGYSIVVYDGYRPQVAVNHFMEWSKKPEDKKMKAEFYPRVDKADVFKLGYVAEKSGHSRGSTVDISLIPIDKELHAIKPEPRKLKGDFEIIFLNDGTINMGSSFDLFDEASHYENNLITEEQQNLRKYLKEGMEKFGFKNYAEEWWHFTLKDEPFPQTHFNFPVE